MSLYKRGETWWYEFVFDGKRIRGSAKTKSENAAKKAERKRRNEVESGTDGSDDIRKKRKRTFDEAAKEYLADYCIRHKSGPTAVRAIQTLSRHFGKTVVSSIGQSAVTGYQRARLKEGAAPKTINEEVGFLFRALGEAADTLRMRLRRDRKLKLPVSEHVGRALTLNERDAILAEARKRRSRHIYPALLLSLDAGMRVSEIRTLQWGRVDLERAIITVGTSKTEAGSGRTIPMTEEVRAALTDHARWFTERFGATDPAYFCFPFGSPEPTDPTKAVRSIHQAWVSVRKRAGIKARFHDGRHTFITNLAESGASAEVTRSIVGHMSSAMTRHYTHVRMEGRREALVAMEALNASRRFKAEESAKAAEEVAQAGVPTNSPTSALLQ